MTLNANLHTPVHRAWRRTIVAGLTLCAVCLLASGAMQAQAPVARPVTQPGVASARTATPAPAPPAASSAAGEDYLIGPTDVLTVFVWGEKELTLDVVVRPDGKISLPLVNDVVAAGFTPELLRRQIAERMKRFVQAPEVTVVVKQVNNNRAFITGQVLRPGPYVLSGPTTVMQLLALAGGFSEFADRKHVVIMRLENGGQRSMTFNYDDIIRKQDLSQNIVLKAGDTVVVP
jgi:polysaccharide export outer membrane protein